LHGPLRKNPHSGDAQKITALPSSGKRWAALFTKRRRRRMKDDAGRKIMNYEGHIYVAIAGFFILFGVYLSGQSTRISKDFQCTESAIVNGIAECVKYEKEKTDDR
jgi:hypothetical protein